MSFVSAHLTDQHEPVHGYLLAGGKSSRMGTDKALLSLRNLTFLDRALTTLAAATVDATLVGRPHPTLPHIPDAVVGIGPVGGVTTALRHLAARGGTWALFLPVDLPLLPPPLLRALVTTWLAQPSLRVAFPVANGFPQPVVSLVHVTALPTFEQALASGNHRLRPLLEEAASPLQALARTPLSLEGKTVYAAHTPLAWQPTPVEHRLAHLWFSNCNTPAELAALQSALLAAEDRADDAPPLLDLEENLY